MEKIDVWKKVSMPENLYEYGDYIYTKFDKDIIANTDDDGKVIQKYRRSWMEHLYKRGVLDKFIENDTVIYKVAHVASRLESFVVLEKSYWLSLSQEIRDGINNYIMNPDIWLPARIENTEFYETVLPIEDSLRILENNTFKYYFLAECNCNNYILGCNRDKYEICIHFGDNEPRLNGVDARGLSKRVTKDEAIKALKYADKLGLIHKTAKGEHNFCNCCVDCCIHHHKAKKYEKAMKGHFIRTPYVIDIDKEACIDCGACTSRCQFAALTSNGRSMAVDVEKCWGCGVCRNNCPSGALNIIKRNIDDK